MIAASTNTLEFHAGYLALTSAEDEKPVLMYVEDIEYVAFEVDGARPSTAFVTHRVGGNLVETIVFESVTDIVALMHKAADEVNFLDDGDDF
jgi:hypothetical protein